MTKEQIISEIKGELAEEFEIEESAITPDALIYDTLQLDSLSLIDLISIVNTKYHVMIQKNELPQLKTFDDLYNFILEHVKDK